MITRPTALIGMAAIASIGIPASSPAVPAPILHPLPNGMTPEFFRELAADRRAGLRDRALTAFQRDRFALDAEIFGRMASQLEPFDDLETELWARDRDIIARHGFPL
ncbi:hypothetical protein HGP16_29260 [Rhizobium sp. P40RR-XXII]|uniref:hypothetical protein n=1 Tax=unclassified Rhizobium TaxID=2613769 RepID=UPI001456A90D|nr:MULTISPECIES: hypothetical protein [unclassified Rhizobium]NLR88912.1 hypothetical protein [Rhizobium sp. P28RR-XV]NLS20610.1 hypothetical protein [Rhizobium sp. P40RR-XXII]